MAVQNCINGTPCADGILNNISGEGPDFITFFSINYPPFNPRLNQTFTSPGCVSECDSTISQDDADQCAARQAILCNTTKTFCDPSDSTCTNGHPTLFYNTPQSCTVFCPDGLPFTYTVPAGLYVGDNQDTVNQEAYQFACTQAARLKICLGNIPRCTCVNTPYTATISATSSTALTWSVIGALPPGMVFTPSGTSATISGTPISPGTFSFQIEAISGLGTFMVKTYTITVIQITTTQLPYPAIGVPYSYQLTATGGSGNYAWKIVSGSLPNGLVMDNTGIIHGTPA